MTYVALLRGINVGGKNRITMASLKTIFENVGCEHVQTVLASGNVLFQSEEKPALLIKRLEAALQAELGTTIDCLIRRMSDIEKLIALQPFKGIRVTPNTRLYVTFLKTKNKSTLTLPYTSSDKNFTILRSTSHEVFSVLTVSQKQKTTDAMKILEKEFGKKSTMRNWNTVMTLAKER